MSSRGESVTIEWVDPPRDYRDECEDIAAQLRGRFGQWAKILTDSDDVDGYVYELERHGIETRIQNGREVSDRDHRVWTHGDLYARYT